MTRSEKQQLGIQRNKLLRYYDVLKYYFEIKKDYKYINNTEIYKDFIYPRFRISNTTFYTILGTPVVKQLKEIDAKLNQEPSLFKHSS